MQYFLASQSLSSPGCVNIIGFDMAPDNIPTIAIPVQKNRGWDSYNAEPTSLLALQTIQKLAICPTVRGGFQIELHAGGVDFELEIGETGKVVGIAYEQFVV